MLKGETSKLASVTHKLKSYLADLDAAFEVFKVQKLQKAAVTEE